MDSIYISPINQDVKPAAPGEFPAISIGPILCDPPVVLAPMAGITNAPFRRLCRGFGAGLYVSEMITARALVERNEKTLRLSEFDPDENPRSLQLYGVDPHYVGEAVRFLVDEDRIDHLDMNFGCPVQKVTRRGGGAAIPAKPKLLEAIVRAAVRAAGEVPVTIKFRMGIDDDWMTFLDAGRIAEAEGCRAISLHARTAAQLYDGEADWNAIGELKQAVQSIPVFGNGDIWEAWDALRMMRSTGCDGVVIGRGCLGRPWLFGDLAAVFAGDQPKNPPTLGEVMSTMREHARLLCEWTGTRIGIKSFRKHATWYTKGFPGSTKMREKLIHIDSLEELDVILAEGDPDLLFPPLAMRLSRGKKGGRQKVSLPEGFRESLDDTTPPASEEPGDGG
jgi:nifR3 family TIM-barrel protein